MDEKLFNEMMGIPEEGGLEAPTDAPQAGGLELDPDALMGSIQAGIQGAQQAASASGGPSLGETIGAAMGGPSPGPAQTKEQQMIDAVGMGGGLATGGLKSVFETKDFLFGDTPPEEQSSFRRTVEQLDADMKEASPIIGGLSSGIGQFAVAMIGIGKLGTVAKAIPKVGSAVAAGEAAVTGVRGGAVALESGKAALAGAVAFDPHEARLSNLIQDTPLANPITAWLAADPSDSAAWGRVKSAMESIGLDAAIIGSLKVGGTIWKKLKAGDTAGASRTISDFERKRAAEPEAGAEVSEEVPEVAATGTGPDAVPSPEATPSASPLQEAQDNVPGIRSDGTTYGAPTATPRFQNTVEVTPRESRSLIDDLLDAADKAEGDWELTGKYGDWQGVTKAGHSLNKDLGERFYGQFKSDRDVADAMRFLVARKAEQLQASGWNVTVKDSQFQKQIADFAALAETSPDELLGSLQQAANQSMDMPAALVVYGSMTSKIFADATRLGWRMHLGDYSEFGSKEAMEQAIAKRFSLAMTMLKDVKAMRANAGRQLRALRGQPFDPSLFEGVSKDRFYQLIAESGGDPTKMKYLEDPDLYTKLLDTANYLRINSLISGWTTQAINLIGNGYMLGVRPLERILGAAPRAAMGNDAAQSMIRENLKQYAYMGTALWDGFGNAVKAFTQNESVIRPHTSEAYAPQNWQVPGSQAGGQGFFKAWDSVPNIIYNALSVPMLPISMPSRTLGSVDELMKQVIYRSKLMARAHIEGVENALDAGLSGQAATDFTKAFVKEKMDKAFDAQGRGLDPEALREADIATFQQDLLPGTLGRGVQTFVANEKTKLTRLILPFVKTPTNVLRYAWKMTPGLNVLQGEYRAMLNGKMGLEAQHQAIGQMTMGALFMGAAAYIGQDRITGGGPSDPKVRQQLLATGWRPYSIVFTNEDGTKRYVPFNRMDPVALPFGIIADIQDALHIMGEQEDDSAGIGQAIGALGISLAKQITSRTYLLSLNQALEAISQPDRWGEAFAGNMAASFIPFSSATRQMSTDPFMRDARTIADKMRSVIPGMGSDLPPKYNWLGQPVVNRQGLWTDDNGTLVDREVQRLSLLPEGSVIAAPSPVWNKVDLRDIQMVNGENAYVAYQRLAGRPAPNAKPLRELIANRIRTDAYLRAPDGDVGTKGTKLWMLNQIVNRYREAAGKRVRADKNVREALMKAQRKVVDHYAHLKQEPTEQQKADLQGILDGFGAGTK